MVCACCGRVRDGIGRKRGEEESMEQKGVRERSGKSAVCV